MELFLDWLIFTIIGTIVLSAIIVAWESFFPPKTPRLYLPEEPMPSDEDMFFPKMKYSDNHKRRKI